jgi:hypothetical protein
MSPHLAQADDFGVATRVSLVGGLADALNNALIPRPSSRPTALSMNLRWHGSSILQLDVQAIDPLVGSSFDGDTCVAAHGFELVEEAGKLESGDALLRAPGAIVGCQRLHVEPLTLCWKEAVTYEGLDAAGSPAAWAATGVDVQEPDG